MIISRAPLRMSFVGGGSDLPEWYRRYGGAVISTAINKYVFVTLNPKFDNAVRVSYSKTENVENSSQIEHGIVRAALSMLNIPGGIEITTIADIPSSGTGLGSSSSFTCALLQALYAYKGVYADAEKLARESCHIEIDICGSPIGRQDQYASAFGGLNHIKFNQDDSVSISPVICSRETYDTFMGNLILFYTGRTRSANSILSSQRAGYENSPSVRESMQKMLGYTKDFAQALQEGDCDAIGPILDASWRLKRSLASGISDSQIDSWYAGALKAGATGGKLLGAGAGGFMLFYAPREKHAAISHALPELKPVPFRFEREGSNIIFYHP